MIWRATAAARSIAAANPMPMLPASGPGRSRAHPRENRHLLQLVGLRQIDLEQEPVTLRLGRVVDPVGLDRILSGQH
jgi:hypothetical protein